jgi:hypothetical protein
MSYQLLGGVSSVCASWVSPSASAGCLLLVLHFLWVDARHAGDKASTMIGAGLDVAAAG